jgi:hypothetical protein
MLAKMTIFRFLSLHQQIAASSASESNNEKKVTSEARLTRWGDMGKIGVPKFHCRTIPKENMKT